MNAILVTLAVISADYRDGYWRGVTHYSYCGYACAFQPVYGPWNAAVAELRARGSSRSRDLMLPTSTANALQELELRRAEVYAALIAAPKAEKAELRRQLVAIRRELEKARLLASKELYRGPGRTQ